MTKSAPHNSNHGILKHLIRATFILATTKAVWLIELFTFVALVYTTPVYANSEASQNPCNSIDVLSSLLKNTTVVFPVPVEHELLNAIIAKLQGCFGEQGHPNHISLTTCWRRIFTLTIAGEHQPKTSYNLAMSNSNVLLVIISACFSDKTTDRKVSEVAFFPYLTPW